VFLDVHTQCVRASHQKIYMLMNDKNAENLTCS